MTDFTRQFSGFLLNLNPINHFLPYDTPAFDLQYVIPILYRELLHTIVQADAHILINEIPAIACLAHFYVMQLMLEWIEHRKTMSFN